MIGHALILMSKKIHKSKNSNSDQINGKLRNQIFSNLSKSYMGTTFWSLDSKQR